MKSIQSSTDNRIDEATSHIEKTDGIQWIPLSSIHHASTFAKSPLLLEDLNAYAQQVEQNGFSTTIVVQPIDDYHYEIVLGYKLFFAANLLQKERIPAIVLSSQNPNEHTKYAILQELKWEDLDDIEVAKAYDLLLHSFHYTHDELARLLQVSRPVITNQLRMLQLPLEIQRDLQAKLLTKSQCHLLLRLSNSADQLELSRKIQMESLSVRQIESYLHSNEKKDHSQQKEWKKQLKKLFPHHIQIDVAKHTVSFSCSSSDDFALLINRLLTPDSP